MPMLFQFDKILNKKTLVFGVSCLAATALYFWQHNSQPSYSLLDVLDYYGFSESQQKQSLEDLMKRSGIIKPTETFMTIFPKRKEFPKLLEDVVRFVELTQQHFTVRTGTQERWEVQPTAWMTKDVEEIRADLEKLNITREVKPTDFNPDVVAVFGATLPGMRARFNYLDKLYTQNDLKFNFLVLLTGERKVTIGIDGTEQELIEIAEKYNTIVEQLTETTLMREAYSATDISKTVPIEKLIVINNRARVDSKTGQTIRPTTETTVQELCDVVEEKLKSSSDSVAINSFLFISSQPYVNYQELTVNKVIEQKLPEKNFQIQVVGDEVKEVSTKTNQRSIGALGTQIWAQTSVVLPELEVLYKDKIRKDDKLPKEIQDRLIKLYEGQALTYSNIKSLLSIPDSNGPTSSSTENHKPKYN